jgi:hypothetical protein
VWDVPALSIMSVSPKRASIRVRSGVGEQTSRSSLAVRRRLGAATSSVRRGALRCRGRRRRSPVVGVSVTGVGYAGCWQVDVSARCAPIRSSLSVSPLCKETIRWMHDPGVLVVGGVTCLRRGVRGERRPVGSDSGPAGRGRHP